MKEKKHRVRINLADPGGGSAENVIESRVEEVPKGIFDRLFGKRRVLVIAPSESVEGIEIFEKGKGEKANGAE